MSWSLPPVDESLKNEVLIPIGLVIALVIAIWVANG